MIKPQLTAERLLKSGFQEVGCWELHDSGGLDHKIDLPSIAGVYAFAIDGIVQYVGLASQSLRKRLGFYKAPGPSQRTNVRLNDIIRRHAERGNQVRVLIGHPPDSEWGGLPIKGAEGLEAGLIAAFELPWNVRGMHGNAQLQVLETIQRRPGLTQIEIAKAVYGERAKQQQVNQHCSGLVASGRIIRKGSGGRSGPYTYHPVR